MVEWKRLHSIVNSISTGLNPRQNFVLNEENASCYYVTVKEITSNRIVFSDSTDKISNDAKWIINKRSRLSKGDILFSGIGTIGKVAYVDMPTNNWDCSESIFLIKPDDRIVNGKYLSYVLSSDIVKKQYERYAAGAIMKGVRKDTLERIQIPIPSPSEQERIVGILDTFTSSIENLKERIKVRKKQYEYCLDNLYFPNKNVLLKMKVKGSHDIKSFDEIGKFIRGRRFVRTDIVEEGVPCIHYGDMYTYYGVSASKTPTYLTEETASRLRFAHKGDVVIVAAGENDIDIGVGVAWLGDEDVVVHDACFIFEHNQHPKYISYFLRSNNYHQQIRMGVVDGKICSISAKELGRTLIHVPSLQEQHRIVSILDTFESSISNLDAQLKQREKQYEYYRNRLLTFG